MQKTNRLNATCFIKNHIKGFLDNNSTIIDGTLGNGNDTLFLFEESQKTSKIYSFDIQKEAILNTKRLFFEKGLNEYLDKRIFLINDSHHNVQDYVKERVDLVILNLGYLPRGDKKIVTKPDTTRIFLEKALDILKLNGMIIITSYTGHLGGKDEYNSIISLLKNLSTKNYKILECNYSFNINNPPIIFFIEKIL